MITVERNDALSRYEGRVGGELVTVITGADCPSKDVESLVAHLAQTYPHVEVHRYDGGQRDSLMLIGVE